MLKETVVTALGSKYEGNFYGGHSPSWYLNLQQLIADNWTMAFDNDEDYGDNNNNNIIIIIIKNGNNCSGIVFGTYSVRISARHHLSWHRNFPMVCLRLYRQTTN
jgi:hypothetical protein